MTKEKIIELGDYVKDIITGYEGRATAIVSYLTGCDQVCIKPDKLDKDGKPIDAIYFDITRIKKLKRKKLQLPGSTLRNPGGPQETPLRGD